MNPNARFYVLAGAVLVIIAGLFFFIRGREDSENGASPLPRAPIEAKETRATRAEPQKQAPLEVLSSSPSTPVGADATPEEGASISGVVVDARGNPVVGSNVTAVLVDPAQPKPRYRAAMTGADGAFTIAGVDAGTNMLHANPPQSYASSPAAPQQVQVGEGEAVTGVRIVADFERGLTIAGRVKDTSGNPVAGAELVAYSAADGEHERRARSDTDGRYSVSGLQAGSYRITVSHADYTRTLLRNVEAPNPNFDVTLRGKSTIEGQVVDGHSGSPVTEFSIVVLRGSMQTIAPVRSPGEPQPFTDPEGRFAIRADDGGATLFVQSHGYAPKLVPIPDTKEGQTTSGVIIHLEAGGVIEGIVTTESGERVAGAQIYVGRMPQSWELQQHRPGDATTDANGAFRLDSLADEAVTISAAYENYAVTSVTAIPSSSDAHAAVQIVLRDGGTISGTVRVDGVAEPGFQISLRFPGSEYQNSAEVDPNGEYTFTSVPEGTATLGLHALGSRTEQRSVTKDATVAAGQVTTVDFDLTSGTAVLEGSVTRGGQPIPGASIELLLDPSASNRDGMGAQADANGEFRFTDLPAGSAAVLVHVNISSANFERTRSFRAELQDGEVTRLEATFDGTGRVTGRVTGIPEGWHAEAGLIIGEADLPDEASAQTAFMSLLDRIAGGGRVAEDGTFQIDDVDAGTFTLIAVATAPGSNGRNFKYGTAPVTVAENKEAVANITIP